MSSIMNDSHRKIKCVCCGSSHFLLLCVCLLLFLRMTSKSTMGYEILYHTVISNIKRIYDELIHSISCKFCIIDGYFFNKSMLCTKESTTVIQGTIFVDIDNLIIFLRKNKSLAIVCRILTG